MVPILGAGWINLGDFDYSISADEGTTPVECDMNHDMEINGLDIQLFVDSVLMTTMPDWRDVCSGDVEPTPDHAIDFDDEAVDFVFAHERRGLIHI